MIIFIIGIIHGSPANGLSDNPLLWHALIKKKETSIGKQYNNINSIISVFYFIAGSQGYDPWTSVLHCMCSFKPNLINLLYSGARLYHENKFF